jgi:two-component sensor histidine kinase
VRIHCHIDFIKSGTLYLFFFLVSFNGLSQTGTNSWLQELKRTIAQSASFDAAKGERINKLKLQSVNIVDAQSYYEHYLRLYTEYSVFNFDSAYHYAKRLREIAYQLNDPRKIAYAGIKLNYVLLSAGMFKEVFDSLYYINPVGLDSSKTAEYYILRSRAYFDLADYNKGNIFSRSYNELGEIYLDSSLLFFPSDSFEYNYYSGLKSIRSDKVLEASRFFRRLMADSSLSLRSQAIVYSTMSDVYLRRGMTDSVIISLVKASIADIKSSTKETTAILHLANFLSNLGDLDNAALFIQKTSSDASTYGARQRMLQLSTILPVIEAKRLAAMRQEKIGVTRYAAIISILLLFLLILGIVVMRQIRRLKEQQKAINDKNLSLHHLLEEKEWLIKEIHHRVKNNLHTITSLLESQSLYLKDEAFDAIRDTQHRVFAMSLIHQKLYQPEKNVMKIDMIVYIHELVNYLSDSFETDKRIRFNMELEPVELDISLAVPLGMILNEAITNSVKYAFPGGVEGLITVAIRRKENNKFLFFVADNGKGLPHEFDLSRTKTLGMKLMKGLSDDIAARFGIDNKQGTRISIEFAVDKSLDYLQKFNQ